MDEERFQILAPSSIKPEKLKEVSDILKKKAELGKKQLRDWIDEKNEKSSLYC